MKAFLFLAFIPQIMGVDLKAYGPFKKGDIILDINIPQENVEVLKARGAVLELSLEDAILLNTLREALQDNYVVDSATVLKVDLRKNARECMTFKRIEDAREYLDGIVKEYKEKELLVNEMGFNSYQIGEVLYILTSKLRRTNEINLKDGRQDITA